MQNNSTPLLLLPVHHQQLTITLTHMMYFWFTMIVQCNSNPYHSNVNYNVFMSILYRSNEVMLFHSSIPFPLKLPSNGSNLYQSEWVSSQTHRRSHQNVKQGTASFIGWS